MIFTIHNQVNLKMAIEGINLWKLAFQENQDKINLLLI
jgi:hypothetical protein